MTDYAVLLTSGNREPKEGFRTRPNLDGHIRSAATAELYRRGDFSKILVSGGGAQEPSLAQVVAQELKSRYGIPGEDILVEEESIDTFENAECSADMLDWNRAGRVYLVTSSFHLPRATSDFTREGIDVVGRDAEGVLMQVDPRIEDLMRKYLSSPEYMKKMVRDTAFDYATRSEPMKRMAHWYLEKKRE